VFVIVELAAAFWKGLQHRFEPRPPVQLLLSLT
jgi:hypothetical protein